MLSKNRILEVIDFANDLTADAPKTEWPVETLNELAFEAISEGARIIASSHKRYEFNSDPDSEIVASSIGLVSISGFFRGFSPISYTETIEDGVNIDIEELTIRVDGANNETWFLCAAQIESLEEDGTDAFELLGNDETLEDIHTAICDDIVDLEELEKIFSGLDVENLRTQIYLDYLNQSVPLDDLFDTLSVKGYLIINKGTHLLELFNQPIVVKPDNGRSFTVVGIDYNDGTSASILCANVVTDKDEYARVPIYCITSLHKKKSIRSTNP